MAKPRIPNQKQEYSKLNRRLAQYVASVQRLYAGFNAEAARIAISTGHDGETPFSWKKYPQTSERVRKLQEWFMRDLGALVMAGTTDEWKRSNVLQDMIADKVMRSYHVDREGGTYDKYYRDNSDALRAFQSRREGGMNISDKLWEQSKVYKNELEDAIGAAIERGTDAITLSKQISKYLIDFPSLQKDYKKKFGKACKSHDCEYRSIRLARSEINMAYRTSEQARWKQFDFVIGYEIKTSGSHPASDVCDRLKGKYPKDFVWTGWHPNCMCYAVPILKTEEEFFEEDRTQEKEVTDYANSEKVDAFLKKKEYGFMFETKDVFATNFRQEDRDAVEQFADRLGRFNPLGDTIQFDKQDIISTQQYVGTENVRQLAKSIEENGMTDAPTGIRVGDKVFIVDGHNRLAAEMISGSNKLSIRCVDVSEEEWLKAGGTKPNGGFASSVIRKDVRSITEVTDVPQGFKDWCKDNWFRICDAKQNGTLPYFIDDNFSRYAENYEYLTKEDAVKFQKDKWIGEFVKVDYVRIAKEKGFTDDEINEVKSLIDNHRRGDSLQDEADLLIRYYMNNKSSRVGDLLRLHADIEEEAYRAYRVTHKNMRIVRKGTIERDSLSYSRNQEGAFVLDSNFERHYLTPDSSTTVDEMLKDFRLVGGLNDGYIGYAEDSEMFFVRKGRKYNPISEYDEYVEKERLKREEDSVKLKGNMKDQLDSMLQEFNGIIMDLVQKGKTEEMMSIYNEVKLEDSIDGYNSLKNFLESRKGKEIKSEPHIFTADEMKEMEIKGWDISGVSVSHSKHEYLSKEEDEKLLYQSKADGCNLHLGGLDVIEFGNAVEEACKGFGISIDKTLSDRQIRFVGNGFEMTRYISEEIDDKGKKHYIVYHSLFDIAKDNQNRGLSKKIFAEHFKLYQKAGYDEVRLRANKTVGGYCWAKYGAMCKKDGPGGVREMVALQREKGLINDVQYIAINKVIDESGEFVQMQKIAFIDGAEKFLKGTNWDGFIDLKSEEQMEYIYSYLGIR